MRSVVTKPLAGATAEINFDDEYPAMAPTRGQSQAARPAERRDRDLGLPQMGELDPLKRGAGDIAFVADKVDALVGFGAAGQGSHAPGESVDLTSFERQIRAHCTPDRSTVVESGAMSRDRLVTRASLARAGR